MAFPQGKAISQSRQALLRIYKRLGRKFSRRGVAVLFRNFSDFSAAYSHSTLLDMGTTPI